MSKPHYYDEVVNALVGLREFAVTSNRFGYLVIKCLSEDLNYAQEICDNLDMHSDDYHIETC